MAKQRKTQVFISYSRKNKLFTRKLNDALDAAGLEAWVDWEGIPFSADWMATITAAIEASDAFIFVISKDSIKSVYCLKELEFALQSNKKIIPVVYSEPGKGHDLHPKLSSTNWVFLRPRKEKFQEIIPKLVDTILTDLDWVQQHTNILQRATQWKQKQENSSYLLSGSYLEEAERWMTESTEGESRQVSPLQAEYIRASRKYSMRRQRNTTFAFGILTALSLILLMFAVRQWVESVDNAQRAEESAARAEASAKDAEQRKAQAEASERLALEKENQAKAQRSAAQASEYSIRPGELDTSTLLAIESLFRFSSSDAENVLRDNLSRMPVPVAQPSHEGRIWNITTSADGQYIISASADGSACVWNIDGEKKYCVQHEADVMDALVTADSQWLVTGSTDGTIRFWTFADGSPAEVLDLQSPVLDLDINPKNTFLVAGREDEYVTVVSINARRVTYDFKFSNGPVSVVRFHPNGDWISIGTREGRVRLWKIMTGLLESGPRHEAEIFDIALSPDGKVTVSVGADSNARISRAETGRQTHVLEHPDWVEDAAFSPDNSWFVTASDDKIVRVFDTNSGAEKIRMYHGSFVQKVAVSPDGNWIASTGYDLSIRIWDSRSGALMLDAFLEGIGSALVFTPDGSRIIAGDRSGNLTIWDVSTLFARIGNIEFAEYANKSKFDPGGNWILVNTDDKNLWQIPVGEITTLKTEEAKTPLITFDDLSAQTKISPDAKWVAVSVNSETGNSQAQLYNVETKVRHTLPHDADITGLAISPDSQFLATTYENGSNVQIWEIETGTLTATIPFEETAFTMAYSPKDPFLAVGLIDKIVLWNLESNTAAATLQQVGHIRSLNFNTEGTWLATTTSNGSIFIWDMTLGDYTAPKYEFLQDGRITSLDFNSSRQWLASGGERYVYLWDLATGQEIIRIPHGDEVTSVSFSPDGTLLSSVSRKIVQFWDLNRLQPIPRDSLVESACQRLTRNLNASEWAFFFKGDEYRQLCPNLP